MTRRENGPLVRPSTVAFVTALPRRAASPLATVLVGDEWTASRFGTPLKRVAGGRPTPGVHRLFGLCLLCRSCVDRMLLTALSVEIRQ